MYKNIDQINKRIDVLNVEIQKLNDECADKLAHITEGVTSRIMSYAQEEEMNNTIDHYTKKLAILIVELEELEEIKKYYK